MAITRRWFVIGAGSVVAAAAVPTEGAITRIAVHPAQNFSPVVDGFVRVNLHSGLEATLPKRLLAFFGQPIRGTTHIEMHSVVTSYFREVA